MRIVEIEDMFMVGGFTVQKHPYIIAGVVAPGQDVQAVFQICGNLAKTDFTHEPSPYGLDKLLADRLALLAGKCVIAGCTINVPGVAGLAGGVLGDPATEPCDAGGQTDLLNCGWQLLTFPGGPGMACEQSTPALSSIFADEKGSCTDSELIMKWAAITQAYGAGRCVAISDGSGAGADGAALIVCRSQVLVLRLDELTQKI